jgi:putative transcriptional regulator
MMTRPVLVKEIREMLDKSGFATSDPKEIVHASFDLVARRDTLILVIKVVLNADSVGEKAVVGMVTLARAVNGSPMIIAPRSGKASIEDGVMYARATIPVISPQTLHDLFLEGVPPMVYAGSGGFYVKVDSDVLREARKGGVSLGELAEVGGVRRRTIQMYEDGMGAKLEVALRLEESLGMELILPVNPVVSCEFPHIESNERPEGLAKEVYDDLGRIGFSVDLAQRCPFDALAHDKKVLMFTGVDQKKTNLKSRAKAMVNLSRILEKHSVIFVDKLGERVNLEGAPLVTSKELSRMEDKKRVIELIEERG